MQDSVDPKIQINSVRITYEAYENRRFIENNNFNNFYFTPRSAIKLISNFNKATNFV